MTKRQTRVLFVSNDASAVSGVGRCIGDLLKHLDRNLISPYFVTEWPGEGAITIIPELVEHDIPVFFRELGHWFPSNQRWGGSHLLNYIRTLRGRVWAISNLIVQHQIDVVYTNGLPTLDAALAAHRYGCPHVWHLHEAVCKNEYLRSYLPCIAVKSIIRKLSSQVVTVSHSRAQELTENTPELEVKVVHNGVDLSRFPNAPLDSFPLKQDLGLPESTNLVVLVGIVSAHKGHDTLVDAAPYILERVPDTAFLLVGKELDDFGHKLRALIEKKGLTEKFFFLGPRDDVPTLLSQSDLLVVPSTQETFSLVALEAMAAVKPVVATRCGGPEEVVVDRKTGYLVAVDDPEGLGERVADVLSDSALGEELGIAGRERAEKELSVVAFAENIQEVIAEVAATVN